MSAQLLAQLEAAFAAGDKTKCQQLLTNLKLALVKQSYLTPSQQQSQEQLLVARKTLELGALFSLHNKDTASFERYLSQLKTYYQDVKNAIPQSENEHKLLGLNLLRLLAQNRISEFHTELELIPADLLHANPFIHHPVEVEQWLMEGAYHKVVKNHHNVPSPEYVYFMDTLVETMRTEIADCSQHAYQVLPLADAAKLMFFSNPAELLNFCAERNWHVDQAQGAIIFQTDSLQKSRNDIPSVKVIENMLQYAQELERIV